MIIKEKTKHSSGYWLIYKPDHPYANNKGRVPEHRLVMEEKIGRIIDTKKEVVHHIDGNKQNNDIKNLQLLSHKDHRRIESGWFLIDNLWYKICRDCKKPKIIEENFYKRSDGHYFYICKDCAKKARIKFWYYNNGKEKQRLYRARKLLPP